jgi:ribosomal protein L20A (L18A)
MGKKFKKRNIIIGLLAGIILIAAGIIYFSPYQSHTGFSYKLIKHTVEIDAPVETVYQFLGNSANASRWSVFVHHIKTLNANEVSDGSVGSIRRCYCNANEQGRMWDELITENIPNKKRQLEIYNLKDFPMTANSLATEQIYEQTSDGKCRLTFTVFFKNVRPALADLIKMHIGSYRIKSIFKKNMYNIQQMVENRNNG